MKKIACSVACVALVAAVPALAGEDTTIVLKPVVDSLSPILLNVISVLVTAVLGWIAKRANDVLGLQVDASMREALHSAAVTGAGKAIAELSNPLGSAKIDVGSPLVATGVNWVIRSVPSAIAHFKLSEADIANLVQSKIGQVQAASERVEA